MHKNERKGKLLNGKEVIVYRSALRGTWIDSSDMITEYDKKEIKIK